MSVLDIESLLAEVSTEEPCGKDLEYDPDFIAMEAAAQGKSEQVTGGGAGDGEEHIIPAVEPDWKEVKKLALQLMLRTRDLRVVTYLSRALLITDKFDGFCDGLNLLHGLISSQWDNLYPLLDAEDANDPTQRINIISSLSDMDAGIQQIRKTTIVQSSRAGQFCLRDIDLATGKATAQSDEKLPEMAIIEAAFLDCDIDELESTYHAVSGAANLLNKINDVLTEKVGAQNAPDTKYLDSEMKRLDTILSEQMVRRGSSDSSTATVADEQNELTNITPQSMKGEITSRADVTRALDKVCEYFHKYEPSSPVPLLLQRAKRLVSKDFMEIMQDLVPDGVNQAKNIAGDRSTD